MRLLATRGKHGVPHLLENTPPGTLQKAYAQGPMGVLRGGAFFKGRGTSVENRAHRGNARAHNLCADRSQSSIFELRGGSLSPSMPFFPRF